MPAPGDEITVWRAMKKEVSIISNFRPFSSHKAMMAGTSGSSLKP